jgi:hypothetical protein
MQHDHPLSRPYGPYVESFTVSAGKTFGVSGAKRTRANVRPTGKPATPPTGARADSVHALAPAFRRLVRFFMKS